MLNGREYHSSRYSSPAKASSSKTRAGYSAEAIAVAAAHTIAFQAISHDADRGQIPRLLDMNTTLAVLLH